MAENIAIQSFVFLLYTPYFFFSVAQQPNLGQGCFIVAVSKSPTIRNTAGMTHLNELSACRRGRYLHNTQKRQTSVPSAGFESPVSKMEWPQTYALHWR